MLLIFYHIPALGVVVEIGKTLSRSTLRICAALSRNAAQRNTSSVRIDQAAGAAPNLGQTERVSVIKAPRLPVRPFFCTPPKRARHKPLDTIAHHRVLVSFSPRKGKVIFNNKNKPQVFRAFFGCEIEWEKINNWQQQQQQLSHSLGRTAFYV